MVTPLPIAVALHPRAALAARAGGATTRGGAIIVVTSGIAAAAVQLLGGMIEPAGRAAAPAAAIAVSLLLPVLLTLFWLASAALIDAAARVMGAPVGQSSFRALSGYAYPVMVVYAAVIVVQSAADRATGTADAATMIGVLNLLVLVWFVGLNAVAAQVTYRLPPLHAAVAAMLPYAALSGLLMLLIVVASVAQTLGVR
jgi:hypothetical protein